MSRYTIELAPREHWGWIQQRTGCVFTSDFAAIVALDSGRIVRGMVGYCNWSPNSVQCHIAADTPLAWRALVVDNGSPAFAWPFLQMGRKMILALVRSDNEKSLHFTSRLGFKEIYRLLDAASDGVDVIAFQMLREECRWLADRSERNSSLVTDSSDSVGDVVADRRRPVGNSRVGQRSGGPHTPAVLGAAPRPAMEARI